MAPKLVWTHKDYPHVSCTVPTWSYDSHLRRWDIDGIFQFV